MLNTSLSKHTFFRRTCTQYVKIEHATFHCVINKEFKITPYKCLKIAPCAFSAGGGSTTTDDRREGSGPVSH